MYRFVLKNTFIKVCIYHFSINIFIETRSYAVKTIFFTSTEGVSIYAYVDWYLEDKGRRNLRVEQASNQSGKFFPGNSGIAASNLISLLPTKQTWNHKSVHAQATKNSSSFFSLNSEAHKHDGFLLHVRTVSTPQRFC